MQSLISWQVAVVVCLGLGIAHTAQSDWYYEKAHIMGTEISVNLWHEEAAIAEEAIAKVFAEMRRIDATLSPYKEKSLLSQINQSAFKQTFSLTPEITFLIDKSLFYSRVTQGAFDITYASVGWYYDFRENKKPDDNQVEALLPAVNYKLLAFNKSQASLKFEHKNLRIDLGGIAKGHAVDRAIQILQGLQIRHANVSAGGDSRIIGDRRGRPWIVGIKNPRFQGDDNQSVIRIPLENIAVSTSGDYERFFIDARSGERIHHIINPKTGRSVKGIASVTILGPLGVDTDALSTSVFVLGTDKGLDLINRLDGFDAIIIDSRGKVHYSQELAPAN